MSGPIAVIGAGMAGAACARALADTGFDVQLFDKGRSLGGRMAQRRVDGHVFDHGAQYLSASEPDFVDQVERWKQCGIVSAWPDAASSSGKPVLVGVPAMNAPVKTLLDGLPASTDRKIVSLSHGMGEWSVRDEAGERLGPFAAIMLAVPAPQAVALLGTAGHERVTGLVMRLGGVRMGPCWSALAAFAAPLPIRASALRFDGDLVWAARNGSKPGRGNGEAWTLHAGPAWSKEQLERLPEEIGPELMLSFQAAVDQDLPEPAFLMAHRWRYALVERPLGDPCIWDPALRLGLCGDWCLGPRIESAWLSGRALAAALAKDRVAS